MIVPDSNKRHALRESIGQLPRVQLANLPTPIHEVPRLTKALGGPRILFKRDDLTGIALSGNKSRMFEFSLAEAKKQGADTVVHCSGIQSNYCRQLAAAASKLGLRSYFALRTIRGDKDIRIQGNLLLMLLAGAEVEILVGSDPTFLQQNKHLVYDVLVERLQRQGRRIYVARGTEKAEALEAVAYVDCALEMHEQLEEMEKRR